MDPTTPNLWEELLKSAVSGGFPAIIAIYLLTRMEAKLSQLTDVIRNLERELALLSRVRLMEREDRKASGT